MTQVPAYPASNSTTRATTAAVIAASLALVVSAVQQVFIPLLPRVMADFALGSAQVPLVLLPFTAVIAALSLVAVIAGLIGSRGASPTIWNGIAVGVGTVFLITTLIGLVVPALLFFAL